MSHELKSINEFNIEKYLRESKDRGANIMTLRQQSEYIIRHALHSVLPDEAVKAVLTGDRFRSVVDDTWKTISCCNRESCMADGAGGSRNIG